MSKQKKLPDDLSEKVIANAILGELNKHSKQLIDEISEFTKQLIPKGVHSATVEVFPDEYGDGFVEIGFYFAGDVNTHIVFAEYANDLPLVDTLSYEDKFSIPDLVVDLIKQWFAESWWKAGGWQYPIPILLYGHEDFGNGSSIKLTKDC